MIDDELKIAVRQVQDVISGLAKKYQYPDYKFWSYLDFHNQEPRENESCAFVMTCDGAMLEAFDGFLDNSFASEFELVLEQFGFIYEMQTHGVLHFYSFDDEINEHYKNLLEWQWITHLIKPEYSDLYSELFDFFERNPEKLYSIKPRQLEYYAGEIFRNRGYEVQLGPGTNDGGVDLRLYQKTEIDQITTLVQVKKYKNTLPIRLDAVAALYGHVEAEKAQEGIFITTSRYLPSAKKFANRLSKPIILSNTAELITWGKEVKTNIIRDKSRLISDNHLLQLVNQINAGYNRHNILVHNIHSGIVSSEYALLLKETKYAALVIMLPNKIIETFDPPYNSFGRQVPLIDCAIVKNKTKENIFRTTVIIHEDGSKAYMGRDKYFTVWKGKADYFDLND